jgi:N-acetylmuramoyl-L-alanine amidase
MADLTHPSPNHNDRRGKAVQVIVLHADASPTEKGCVSWVQSSQSKVSYHCLIGRRGEVYRFVPFDRRAWHSGKAEWNGEKDVNGIAVGLSFSNKNDGKEPLTKAQIVAMQDVVQEVRDRYGPIPVTTHAAVAPGRKDDPEKVPGFRLEDYQ